MTNYEFYEFVAESTYGQKCSIQDKRKFLAKYGRNTSLALDTEEQVWVTGGLETLSTTNDITHFASTNAGDTQTIKVEGHTVDASGDFTFVVQTATLAGQTKTALTTPLARVTRLINTGTTNFAGTVTVAKDVVFTTGTPASDIHLTVTGADNQSLKAATTISKNDFWFIEEATFSVQRSQGGVVDFKLQVREKGGVFRTKKVFTLDSSSSPVALRLATPIIIPPNSDVRVTATASAAGMIADAYLDGPLGIIV